MNISYCSTCHNRLWQLEQTLRHNLEYTEVGVSDICILFYNDLKSFESIQHSYKEHIKDGRLKIYFHEEDKVFLDGTNWSCGPVKHIIHSLATGDVLFNLDADNFIDDTLHSKLLNLGSREIIINSRKDWRPDGRSGRIGIHSKVYKLVEGYRDKGRSDDGDFILQCVVKQHCKIVDVLCEINPISNNKIN